jgi:hypothetical protein
MQKQPPASTADNIVQFPPPKPRLRAGVPQFDPNNPAHLRAWEALFDFGCSSTAGRR